MPSVLAHAAEHVLRVTGNESPCGRVAVCARGSVRASALRHDGTGTVAATWVGTAEESQTRLVRRERAAQPSLNGGRAAVATESASQSDAGRDEGEAKGNVMAGDVHEEAGRASEKRSDERHEVVVRVSERAADAHGEEGRGTLRKGVVYGEAVRVTARQVVCGGLHNPCRGGLGCGYACHGSPFLDPYHGVVA